MCNDEKVFVVNGFATKVFTHQSLAIQDFVQLQNYLPQLLLLLNFSFFLCVC